MAVAYFGFFKGSGPVNYNNKLIGHQEDVIEKIDKFLDSLEQGSSYEGRYRDVLEQIESSLAELRQMPDYKGNTEFRDKMIEFIEFYESVAENDFKDIIDIVSQGGSNEALANIWNTFASDQEPYLEDVGQAQQRFADQFDMKIEKR